MNPPQRTEGPKGRKQTVYSLNMLQQAHQYLSQVNTVQHTRKPSSCLIFFGQRNYTYQHRMSVNPPNTYFHHTPFYWQNTSAVYLAPKAHQKIASNKMEK